MPTIIKPSASIRQNYTEIATLCKTTGEPVFLTKNGEECAIRLLDAYDKKISYPENTPLIDCARLRYIPSKYRVLNFRPHLWLVFQIKEDIKCVKIEYIIDDRQNYGTFLK